MLGRAALADPWIFRRIAGGPPASRAEAVAFAHRYAEAIATAHGPGRALARLKQLVRWYQAGGLFDGDEARRQSLLRGDDLAALLAALAS
jgi:tRNA-dihydrouridine synthase